MRAAALVLLLGCGLVAAGVAFVRLNDGPSVGNTGPTADSGPTAVPAERTVGAQRAAEPTMPSALQDGAAAARGGAGGVLRLPGADPTTLDPARVRDVVSAQYLYEIYSGLVTLSPELEVVPDLATDWQLSPSGTVYTFTLRADATFHDGRPVTADDVAWSLERTCDPATRSLVAETYLGDIVGCRAKLAGTRPSVDGVEVVDEQTLQLTIDAPKAYFLSKLTYPTSFVLDRQQLARDPGWERQPNGSGPFRLARYEPETQLVLERHDGYHGPLAYLERVEFDLRPLTPVTRYENGELDATPVGIANLARVRDPLNPLSDEVVEGPGDLGLTYVGFNTRAAPLDDVNVRRALNFALDKARLAEIVLEGAVEPADWILPPGMPGHTPGISPYTFDLERARAELAESRYGDAASVPPFTLTASGSGGGDPVAEAVADFLSEGLALEIQLQQTPWETFQDEIAAGEYQAFILGWSADYPDPQDFLDVLFHSQSGLNHTGFASPEVDRLLEQARVERDEEARMARYAEAERQVLEHAPWLPLYHGVETWLVAPYVEGFTLPPIVLPRLADVRLVR